MNSSQAFSQSRMIAAYFLPQVPVSWSVIGHIMIQVTGSRHSEIASPPARRGAGRHCTGQASFTATIPGRRSA
jgi:hypothetical protein